MRRAQSLIIALIVAAAGAWLALPALAAHSPRTLVAAIPLLQTADPDSCRAANRSWSQLDVDLREAGELQPGQVLSFNDSTLATILVVSGVDGGLATSVDFAASVRISGIVLRSGDVFDVRTFDPPVRNGSNLKGPEGGAIDSLSFCYRVNIPAPPEPAQPTPADETAATEQPTEPAVTEEAIEPTATTLTLDTSGMETAEAARVALEATATAAAAAAEQQRVEFEATAAAQATVIASREAELAEAQATIDALQATIAAPTATAPPAPTPTPTATVVVFDGTGSDALGSAAGEVDGWASADGVVTTDGSSGRNWVVVPVPQGLTSDYAVEVDLRVIGGDVCPRNFGIGIRGSENGFYAGGVEWACDPMVMLWAGGQTLAKRDIPDGIDLTATTHTVRVEAVGNRVVVAIDNVVVIDETNDQFTSGNLVAVWSDGVGLEIGAVRIIEGA